ncbi:MAG: putative DNA polymerase [Prokaryotic dsDNA virus sp.]|jgi:DNA polymerase I-like protein with 3'-5' exonuclease and polymerase domains|nr:MAG: putative DNA polymerase [Prokaryotic dsDNA virus sp.]|tara:strand:+ start:53070 stop:55148 length:2079 start_codon:yes stop_codon:yes gene_type:complete
MAARKKSDPNNGGALQLGFFMPEAEWRPPSLSDLPSWKDAKRIAIDAETRDPSIGAKLGPGSLRDGYTVGWSFAIEGGPRHYLPIRHEGGDNLDCEMVLRYLREQIKGFDREFVGANLAYDIDYGYNDGFEWNQDAKFRDIQIADPLIYELHRSYSLDAIGKRYGIEAKDESTLLEAARAFGLDPKKGLWRLPGRYVGKYGEQDVASPLEILKRQEEIIERDGLQQIWELESRVIPVLVRMRRRGVRIDFDKLERIEKWAESEERKALDLIKRETGVQIGFGEVWKPGALAPALEAIGMRLPKTATGAPSIDRDLLGGSDHVVPQAILRARKVNKLRTTFAASIRKYAVGERLHCSFRQMAMSDSSGDTVGVRFGRLSAADPNLQQQPSPDRDPEIAGEWRKIFIPEEDALWGCNDYSQQEPRWTTHFAAVLDLPRAREAALRYQNDPSTDNHDMMTRLVYGDKQVDEWFKNDPKGAYKVHRGYSKNIFLGLCYGEGGAKLCRDIGKPTRWAVTYGWGKDRRMEFFETQREAMSYRMEIQKGFVREMAGEEGQEILDNFDSEVPYVRELAKAATERAKAIGFVKTILGRRLNFERREDGSYDFTHKALNRVIQGSSADQTKLAICELDRAGHFIQLQVHDDTNGSYSTVAEAKEAGNIMRDCIIDAYPGKLWVPFRVDTEVGPSWGEIKSVE